MVEVKDDTRGLLKECSAGIKMAVRSIDEVLDTVENNKLKKILEDSKAEHEKEETKINVLLAKCDASEQEPKMMASAMSWLKINAKIMADNSDKTVAGLIIDGCDMGIKSLCGYKNEYSEADREAQEAANRLIDVEEKLAHDLREYL